MMTSNNALIPDPDKEDILASKPFDWPFMRLGLRMCGWGDTQTKYYLLGTPVIWWGGACSLIASVIALGVYLMRMQRKYVDMEPSKCNVLLFLCLHHLMLLLRRVGSLPLRGQDSLVWMDPSFL